MGEVDLNDEGKKGKPLYSIGIAAELVGTTDQTLRLYEKHGLVKPARRNKNRYYSDNDIKWLVCVRGLIHNQKISIEGVKRLLDYAPCWEIKGCTGERREDCTAYMDRSRKCWEMVRESCKNGIDCDSCVVYLNRLNKP